MLIIKWCVKHPGLSIVLGFALLDYLLHYYQVIDDETVYFVVCSERDNGYK